MSFKLNIFLVLLGLNVFGVFGAEFHEVTELPKDTPTCQENDKIDDCVRNSIQFMLKRSKNGVPELNIPAIDPLVQQRANVQFQNNLVQGKAAVRNLKVVGLSETTVDKASFKRNGNHITLITRTRTPQLQADGQYKAELFVNNVKLSSKGVFNITMTDVVSDAISEAELYERDGHTYYRLTSFNIDPTLGDMKIFATGLIPDPSLNAAILEFVNQNWRQIYKSVIPETRPTWEPLLLQNANEVFSHLPFDLILTQSS